MNKRSRLGVLITTVSVLTVAGCYSTTETEITRDYPAFRQMSSEDAGEALKNKTLWFGKSPQTLFGTYIYLIRSVSDTSFDFAERYKVLDRAEPLSSTHYKQYFHWEYKHKGTVFFADVTKIKLLTRKNSNSVIVLYSKEGQTVSITTKEKAPEILLSALLVL